LECACFSPFLWYRRAVSVFFIAASKKINGQVNTVLPRNHRVSAGQCPAGNLGTFLPFLSLLSLYTLRWWWLCAASIPELYPPVVVCDVLPCQDELFPRVSFPVFPVRVKDSSFLFQILGNGSKAAFRFF
jgi:hypothetical protein